MRVFASVLTLLAFAGAAEAQTINAGGGCAPGIICAVGTITGSAADSFSLSNVAASATVPTINPDKGDATTGIGSAALGNPVMIASGTRVQQWGTFGTIVYVDLLSSTATSFRLQGQGATATLPTFSPNRADAKAGIGADAAGDVSLIVDVSGTATEALRAAPLGVFALGAIPTVTGTGTPTIASGSTDTAGEATTGTSGTSLVITFASTKTNAPFCTVTPQTQLLAFAYTISTTAITITQTATTGEKIDYHCFQH
jgi:hypothetical protein